MSDTALRILDTGTRAATPPSEIVEVRHQPALVRRRLPVDADQLSVTLSTPAHIVFYSRFAVQCMADRITDVDDHRLWAVGPKTAARVGEAWGVDAEFPDEHHFSGLRAQLEQCDDRRRIVAFGLRGKPRDLGDIADDWNTAFHSIDVYSSEPAPGDELRTAFDDFRPHWIAVTSSRGAQAIADGVGRSRLAALQSEDKLRVAAIGPSTAQTLTGLEIRPDLICDDPDRDAMLEAIAETT